MALFSNTPGSTTSRAGSGMGTSFEIDPKPNGPLGPGHAMEVAGGFVAVLYVIHAVAWVLSWLSIDLRGLGILPRTISGLIGILFAPLLHANWNHLFANTIPMFILTAVLFSRTAYKPVSALIGIWILGGIGTWLLARGGAVHIGASGLIYGIAAYVVAAGFTMHDVTSVLIGVVIAVTYSGLVFGLMPGLFGNVSWEGHLFGAAAGVALAFLLHDKGGIPSL